MDALRTTLKTILTIVLVLLCPCSLILTFMLLLMGRWVVTACMAFLIIPMLFPFIWMEKKKLYGIIYGSYILVIAVLLTVQWGVERYDKSITIDTAPTINVEEYLPFAPNSKIVKQKSKTLSFRDVALADLPAIDGAAALLPVYSAYVHAVYPETTELNDGAFFYSNTVEGYRMLAEKITDLFLGVAPSEEQLAYAKEQGTTFTYTQVGSEAFVFFVHKDNPIESLTLEQVKAIYSGQITNWKSLGGKDEEIVAFQRNEGSGSQSMLLRLMGDTPVMEPKKQTRSGGMGMIIEEVASYKNKTSSIGFSFRYYVEGIIKNPDIKMIAIDGVAPTAENIRNGSYPIITPIYLMGYENNPKENVQKLTQWILSEEGQEILEKTGYVGLGD